MPLPANLAWRVLPAIYLIAILVGLVLHFVWPIREPIRSELGKAVRRVDRGSCCSAFHLVDQNILLSGHAGARKSTEYRCNEREANSAKLTKNGSLMSPDARRILREAVKVLLSIWKSRSYPSKRRGSNRSDVGSNAKSDARLAVSWIVA